MSAERRQDQHYEWGSSIEKASRDMLPRVRCKTRHTIILQPDTSRRKPSGLCKIERRTRIGMISLEKIPKHRSMQPRSQSLIGRKSLRGWIADRDDLSESGDSGERVPGALESRRLGHLIIFRPQTRLIMHKA